ncbi:TraB/GumN family protein [Pseudoxanthomonas kalamensis]|uniref:TraB/GumN family protein n=1 Tax=Pseudoxanthomonas kalamensis TaxID=289483 RepID=UPI001FEBF6C7|nr:TraB/GumN family protein [Pseudoxanthomonas kalamensis]
MDTIVVSGTQPGPGLWKVSKGDHVLWILGTVSPLPGGIEWKSDEVRAVLEQADQILASPGVSFGADIGFFRGLMLAPSAMKAMKNPGGETLQELLPAETYARWAALKQRYIGKDRGIEKKRPFIAAEELYGKAVKRSGLGGRVISSVIDDVLKRRKMEYTTTVLKISVEDPRQAIADFRQEQSTEREVACMSEVLDTVERDLPKVIARANAWASGDLQALGELPLTERKSCWAAWAESETMRKRGIGNVAEQVKAHWLGIAEKALAENHSTFAMLPISRLLAADGYLADLAAKGYAVEAPYGVPEFD